VCWRGWLSRSGINGYNKPQTTLNYFHILREEGWWAVVMTKNHPRSTWFTKPRESGATTTTLNKKIHFSIVNDNHELQNIRVNEVYTYDSKNTLLYYVLNYNNTELFFIVITYIICLL